jgi:hypothetical protein
MVVLLAAAVIGGLVWLARLKPVRPRTDRARTDGRGQVSLTGRSAESGYLPR